ncbi:MAG TPA: peptidylprolyl isomerase, partial [Vicinamibacterales bacterium]
PPDVIARAMRDPDPHVRLEAVRATARRGADGCPALAGAMKDADTHVALAAIDALARCADPAHVVALAALAAKPGGADWHRASHALVALAAVDPDRARALTASHAADKAWPVRMYAAQAAARLGDDSALAGFAADAHPNVREAAIAGLAGRAKDPAQPSTVRPVLKTAVLAALAERRDPQLLRTAAGAVALTGDAPAFKDALLDALDAIDGAGGETTIDARVAIVNALKIAAPEMAPPPPPRPREAMTPSVQELRNLPSRARIQMARGGVIELELLPDEAPATVARFARLARAGYYDGLTFHRVVPNFVIQGGSPWANEYAGAPRFQRDELGFARHDRGAVGISTRGRDTGDAQIFIDLVDLPRLNHDYTVFARVVSGMDAVDGILEADVIQRISILK